MKSKPPRKAGQKLDSLIKYSFEQLASNSSPVPYGYIFVPKGNVYITRHCRISTEKLGQTLYVVYDPQSHERLGLRCPRSVYDEVNAENTASAPERREAVRAKDNRDIERARNAILRLFPQIPLVDCQAVLDHGFKKGSGRVGRSSTLDDDEKVNLAIVAHIRHTMTPYDTIMNDLNRDGIDEKARRVTARVMIRDRINGVLDQWRSPTSKALLRPVLERSQAQAVRNIPPKARPQPVHKAIITSRRSRITRSTVRGRNVTAGGSSLQVSTHAVQPNVKSQKVKRQISTKSARSRQVGASKPVETLRHLIQPGAKFESWNKSTSQSRFSACHMAITDLPEASIHAIRYELNADQLVRVLSSGANPLEQSMCAINSNRKRDYGVDESLQILKRSNCEAFNIPEELYHTRKYYYTPVQSTSGGLHDLPAGFDAMDVDDPKFF